MRCARAFTRLRDVVLAAVESGLVLRKREQHESGKILGMIGSNHELEHFDGWPFVLRAMTVRLERNLASR